MKKMLVVLAVVLGTLSPLASGAFAGSWKMLGAKSVGFIRDRDEIPVRARKGTYRRIKFAVHDAPVEFKNVTVVFGNGERFDVPIRSRIPAGGQTRVIDLPGRERVIQKIILVYQTKPRSRERAKVSVWGLKG